VGGVASTRSEGVGAQRTDFLRTALAPPAAAEYLFIKISRSIDVGDGDEMCHGEPVARGHLIVLLLDLYAAH
jgi:hypothetical protein